MYKSITFKRLNIPKDYGKEIFRIYYVIEKDKSLVMEKFNSLNNNEKDLIKELICRMATVRNFRSPKIKYNIHEYNYGEIRPFPHRFFFFQKCGNNYIFISYILKTKNRLNDKFYRELDKKKVKYEKAFEEFIKRN